MSVLLWEPRPRRIRADAWGLSDRGAPSPRGYLRLVDRWAGRYAGHLRRMVEGIREAVGEGEGEDGELSHEQVTRAVRLLISGVSEDPPEPPTPRQIRAVGEPGARRAIAAEHRALVAAGMPRRAMVDALEPQQRADPMRADAGPLERGIDLLMAGIGQSLLEGWAEEGSSLIRTGLRTRHALIAQLATKAVTSGRRWESLIQVVDGMGARSRAHARLVARDQVARLNGQITENMHKSANVKEYVWLTSDDERVRDSHRDAHGQTFAWDSEGAPDVGFYGEPGHPGQCGQCRCRARPVPPPGNEWAVRPIPKATYREAPGR